MAYKGKYKVKNKEKYLGDIGNVIYRSSWERALMYFCDTSPKVKKWGSEILKIPYISEIDFKHHNYIVDFLIQFSNDQWYLIEVKPKKEVKPPKAIPEKTENRKKHYRKIREHLTWSKNKSKWAAAKEYAARKGAKFAVWTEDDLRALGLKIL